MPITDPVDTLRHHQSRVLTTHRDMSAIPVSAVTVALQGFMASTPTKSTVPEAEALWFYGLNHGMALISQQFDPLEPLPKAELDFVKFYHATLTEKAARAFYYLILICTREARHCKSMAKHKPDIAEKFGSYMATFMSTGSGEQGIHNNLLASPPAGTIGNYVKCLQWMFYNTQWGGGYGGPAWGKVTDCLVNFVTGTFSAEMMLDTIWTLSHNNGPIFNKGHLYGHHSSELLRILDLQRAGMIPTAALEDGDIAEYVVPEFHLIMQNLVKKYDLPTYVDWYTVEALGAVKKYPHEKKVQGLKYGLPPHAAEAEKKALEAAQIAEAKLKEQQAMAKAKAEQDAAEFAKNHVEIYPGFHAKKFHPKRAA